MEFIFWCNENAGFLTALQTLSTVLLSMIAILIAAYAAWLPFKKGLRIYSGLNYDRQGAYTMDLFLYNSGNAPLYIKSIQLLRQYPGGKTDILALGGDFLSGPCEENFLAPKMAKSFCIRMVNCNEREDKKGCKIRIEVETEEKTFVKITDWAVG